MPEDTSSLSSPGGLAGLPDIDRAAAARLRSMVGYAVGIGLVLCTVTVVVGLRMALHATRAPCENGHYFPEGTTDFRCFAHNHAGDGTVITIFSIVLGILLSLAGLIADVHLRRSSSR